MKMQIVKRIANPFAYPMALAFLGAVLLAFIVLASASPSQAASPEPGVAAANMDSKADRVEARIKELYTKLKITPEQEELWKNVTQVMRDNAKIMEELIKARVEKAGTMTAVDDLKSYSEIAAAHADGLKMFIPAFEPLYASMSDAQKKDADKFFRHQARKMAKAKAKAKAKSE